MMKLKCPNGCGAIIDAADPAVVQKQMDAHVADQHGSLAERYDSVLKYCQVILYALAGGAQVPKKTARELHNKVSALLGGPVLPEPAPLPVGPVVQPVAEKLTEPENSKKDGEQ